MTLGGNLQNLRKEAGLSQEQVAQALFVSRQSVSKWENDQAEPGVENLKTLAKLYGVTLDRLVGMETPSKEMGERAPGEPFNLYHTMVLLFALGTFVCTGSIVLAYDMEAMPFALLSMIAMTAGVWVRRPAVWWSIQGLLGFELAFLVLDMLGVALLGMAIYLPKILLNGIYLRAMCRKPVKRRFGIEE